MGELITEMFGSFTTVITGVAGGIKDAFMQVLYVDPEATTLVLSDVSKFGFVMAGLTLALGLTYKAFGLIRGRR